MQNDHFELLKIYLGVGRVLFSKNVADLFDDQMFWLFVASDDCKLAFIISSLIF